MQPSRICPLSAGGRDDHDLRSDARMVLVGGWCGFTGLSSSRSRNSSEPVIRGMARRSRRPLGPTSRSRSRWPNRARLTPARGLHSVPQRAQHQGRTTTRIGTQPQLPLPTCRRRPVLARASSTHLGGRAGTVRGRVTNRVTTARDGGIRPGRQRTMRRSSRPGYESLSTG